MMPCASLILRRVNHARHTSKRAGLSAGSFVGAMARAPLPPAQVSRATQLALPHAARQGRSRDGAHVVTGPPRSSSLSDRLHRKFLVTAAEMSHSVEFRPRATGCAPPCSSKADPRSALQHSTCPALGRVSDGDGRMAVRAQRRPQRSRIALRMRVEIGVHHPARDERNDAGRQYHMNLAPRELALDNCTARDRRQRHAADRREPDGAPFAEAVCDSSVAEREISAAGACPTRR
jgi:hypothetical protein